MWCTINVNVTCLHCLKCVVKLNGVPHEWLFRHRCGWVGDVCRFGMKAALCTLLSYLHMISRDVFIPKDAFISYMHKNLRWFYGLKPMVMVYLFLKQVTRNGIFDSSSVCFENMKWFTYLKMKLNMWLEWRARKMVVRSNTLDSGPRGQPSVSGPETWNSYTGPKCLGR